MEDQNNKKPFIIPKTHTSNKDALISEKTDSRNVIELFNDMKSCALELNFDFRQNDCQSCDIIRNQKLQKLYNERKIQMKKDHDFTERFAFHLITSRDMALNIATNGLSCEQLSFSIEKYLGNPKDGIHLSRRPDVLLASSGVQGLQKFGLLVCKIILGKGYATIPSINNKQFSAQLHYDYHFCKIQTKNKEQRRINDLLANSLIFCYQHEEFQTLSHPSQILPLAILWYDLKEKFSSELIPISQESEQRNTKPIKLKNAYKKKAIPSLNTGTWDEPIQDTTNIPPVQTTPTKYPNQFMLPYSSLYTSFSNPQSDPHVIRTVISSETIPLSPQSDISLSLKQVFKENKISLIDIPLNSTIELIDPRLKTFKQTQKLFYLESKAVKHALQQQKRLKNYSNTTSKTTYTLIPFHIRSISSNEYEQSKNSSSLFISVIDCFHFGLNKSDNQLYIDLEENQNQVAYEQIQISNRLIEQKKQLTSQEIRLHLKEKRQKKIQEQIFEQKKNDLANSKVYIHNGRKLLKEHQIITPINQQISLELLDFFSYEYQHDKRPHVKRILSELIGVFVEKYGLDYQQITSKAIEAPIVDHQTINSVIDMELESSASQGLADYDERFRVQTPLIAESVVNQPLLSLPLIQSYDEPNQTSGESNNNIIQLDPPTEIELPSAEPTALTNDVTLTPNIEQTESPSNETNNIVNDDDSRQIIIPNLSIEIDDNSNRSRDDFVKLLAKEAYTSKSPSPSQTVNHLRRSYDDNDDDDDLNSNKKLSTTRTVTLVSNNRENKLLSETTNTDEQKEEEQPTVKRIKVDLVSIPPLNDEKTPPVTLTDDHDYRQDLDERRQQSEASRSRSKSTSSHTSSIKESKTKSPSSSSSRSSSIKNRYHQNRRNDSNRSYHYHQRNTNHSDSSHSQLGRHQRFNYNHQSVADHPRFAHVDTLPSPGKNLNYNSFGTSDYSQSITNSNRNQNASYYNDLNSNYDYYQDNYNNNLPQPPPLMSTTPLMNFSNSYDLKPSNTIERLQMFLENTNTSYDHRQSSSYRMYSSQNNDNNNSHWSSSRYSSKGTSDTTTHDNQTFTCNDAEQLLTFVQHLRN